MLGPTRDGDQACVHLTSDFWVGIPGASRPELPCPRRFALGFSHLCFSLPSIPEGPASQRGQGRRALAFAVTELMASCPLQEHASVKLVCTHSQQCVNLAEGPSWASASPSNRRPRREQTRNPEHPSHPACNESFMDYGGRRVYACFAASTAGALRPCHRNWCLLSSGLSATGLTENFTLCIRAPGSR